MDTLTTVPLRLPRRVEADPRLSVVLIALTSDTRLLWRGGEIRVPVVRLTDELAAATRNAFRTGRLVRGLERARQRLEDERRGLLHADRSSRETRGPRVSRLLLLTNDGSERFYRAVESLLHTHGTRVLAVLLDADAAALGGTLFGGSRIARLVMIEHKDAVSDAILSLARRGDLPDTPS